MTFRITPIGPTGLEGTPREVTFLMREPVEEEDDMTFEARLTLETGVAVSTTDQTGKTTIYLTPYKGNRIRLYDGAEWVSHSLSADISIAVPATTNTMYDLFVYDNTGTLTLEAVAWTNDTTRATALAKQDGVYVKTGATGRRYVGSFRTTGVSGQTEDSLQKRLVWNYYNRVARELRRFDSTDSWAYSTASYRQANNSTSNKVEVVIGAQEDVVDLSLLSHTSSSGATLREVQVAIGLDSTTAKATACIAFGQTCSSTARASASAMFRGLPGLGYHYLSWLEHGAGADTQTWYGDAGAPTAVQSGLSGFCFA
jgi:hypothetical protein